MTRLVFCQNDSQIGGSFWQKDSLITHILFELYLFWYLAQSTYLWDTLYLDHQTLETIDPATLHIILKIGGFLNQLKLRKSQLELSEKWFVKSLTIEWQTQLNSTNMYKKTEGILNFLCAQFTCMVTICFIAKVVY